MKSLFSEPALDEIQSRIQQLSKSQAAHWGQMDVSQMLCHCKGPLQISLGQLQPQRPNALMRLMFSFFKSSLYNDKPWKPGLPTAKEFIIKDPKDFEKEKSELLALMEAFHSKKEASSLPPHPMFGDFTMEQWGQMQYKHLDHHLRQFGV